MHEKTYMHVHTPKRTYTHIHRCPYIQIFKPTSIHTQIDIIKRIYIHENTYMHSHTPKRMYTHTHAYTDVIHTNM